MGVKWVKCGGAEAGAGAIFVKEVGRRALGDKEGEGDGDPSLRMTGGSCLVNT